MTYANQHYTCMETNNIILKGPHIDMVDLNNMTKLVCAKYERNILMVSYTFFFDRLFYARSSQCFMELLGHFSAKHLNMTRKCSNQRPTYDSYWKEN